jgi:16S rRNA (cytosine967-C5)-methyltransferase
VQQRLLSHAVTLTKPGGLIVYCTCSLEPEEGEQIVAGLLARDAGVRRQPIAAAEVHGMAELLTPDGDLRTFPSHLPDSDPQLGGMDGFYAARLVKA